jgi:hypothetical protein
MVSLSLGAASGRVFAGPWSTQPSIGLAAEYASNPQLQAPPADRSETNAAFIADLPMNYDLDSVHFMFAPRVRYSNHSGYSAVTSNYYHLDSSLQFADELGSLTFAGAFYRDSSLLYAAEVANGVGVRRDTSTQDANWLHAISERLQFQVDLNTARTSYGQSTGFTNLIDYRYSTLSPALIYSASERDTVKFIGSTSRYDALDHTSSSDTNNVQVGLDHALSELWTLSALTGYSKSLNQYRFFFGTLDSSQTGAIYTLTLSRRDENLTTTVGVARTLTPTGSAFLSRSDSITGSFTYNSSERWTFSGAAVWSRINDPVVTGSGAERRYYNTSLTATCHWTEQWNLILQVARVGQTIAQSGAAPASNNISIAISRQFYRTNQ